MYEYYARQINGQEASNCPPPANGAYYVYDTTPPALTDFAMVPDAGVFEIDWTMAADISPECFYSFEQ